ncbi:MAG: hypothetical protein K2Y14_04190 [Burkholderiales bacterium]|nr:hypothetical protein [Burkholderiales bacterium]
MNKVYVKFNAANQFDGFHLLFQDDALPENAFIIDGDQHDEYLNALNSQLKNIILVDGEIQIVDKYTPEELAARQAIEVAQALRNQANRMLIQTDRFEHDVYQAKMQGNEPDEFDVWRIELLDVALGDGSVMPTTPEFMQKFLEL